MAVIIALMVTMVSCDVYFSFVLQNNSDEDMYTFSSTDYPDILNYPDTTIGGSTIDVDAGVPKLIKSCESAVKDMGALSLFNVNEIFFEESFRQDTLSVAYISADTVAKYGWDDVLENYRVYQRYDLSLHDFNMLKGRIPCPPTPEMMYIKMYPPYGTYTEK